MFSQALTWLKKACILFGIETPRVCSGGYRVFKAEASTLFKHVIVVLYIQSFSCNILPLHKSNPFPGYFIARGMV